MAEDLGGKLAYYCRQKIQFAFAANKHAGRFADFAYVGISDRLPQDSGERLERRRRVPLQEPPKKKEKRERRNRDLNPRKGNQQSNHKRDDKEK